MEVANHISLSPHSFIITIITPFTYFKHSSSLSSLSPLPSLPLLSLSSTHLIRIYKEISNMYHYPTTHADHCCDYKKGLPSPGVFFLLEYPTKTSIDINNMAKYYYYNNIYIDKK
jgi:hypothetical protein